MDEPFAAVDAQTRADLEDLIRSVWQRLGVTLLSVSPTHVVEDLAIDLSDPRDQLTTRGHPRFTELRGHVYAQIQKAKTGSTP